MPIMVGTQDKKDNNHIEYSNNTKLNNKVNTSRNTHTRWNSDPNQVLPNNTSSQTTAQLHKRDEWHEKQDNSATNNNNNYTTIPKKRAQLTTSLQYPLEPQQQLPIPLGTGNNLLFSFLFSALHLIQSPISSP